MWEHSWWCHHASLWHKLSLHLLLLVHSHHLVLSVLLLLVWIVLLLLLSVLLLLLLVLLLLLLLVITKTLTEVAWIESLLVAEVHFLFLLF